MFEWNHSGNVLVNVNHVRRLSIDAPSFEQKDYVVWASLTYGTEIMYRGTEAGCRKYMEEFAARH